MHERSNARRREKAEAIRSEEMNSLITIYIAAFAVFLTGTALGGREAGRR
jgi:hypothetical protein